MTDELKSAIQKIRKLSPKLNKATDEACATVERVEKFLNEECSIGLAVRTLVYQEAVPENHFTDLVYDRVGGKFRIAVQVSVGVGPIEAPEGLSFDEPKAWAECSRDIKLASFAELPTLLKTIAEEVEKISSSTANTAKAVNAIVNAMNGK